MSKRLSRLLRFNLRTMQTSRRSTASQFFRSIVHPLRLCLLLRLCLVSSALYRDQLGKFDFHRQGLGVPIFADLHPRKPRMVTVTDAVVAHVHLRDGEIHWRRHLQSVTHVFVSHRDNSFVTVEEETPVVQLKGWSQGDGAMRWQRGYPMLDAFAIMDTKKWSMVVTLREGQLEARGAGDDAVMWNGEIPEIKECEGTHVFVEGKEKLWLVSSCKDRLFVSTIEGDKGERISTIEMTIRSPDERPTAAGIVDERLVVIYPHHLCTGTLQKGEMECVETTLRHVLLGGLRLEIDDVTGLNITVYDSLKATHLHQEVYHQLPVSFHLDRLFLGSYARKDTSTGFRSHPSKRPEETVFRFLCVGRHGEVILLQQEQMVWMRNEALTGTVASMFVDPPTKGSRMQTDVTAWMQAQWIGLKIQFRLAEADDRVALEKLKSTLSGKHLTVRDARGYRKYVLVLTRYRTVMALHNGDGRILWQTHLPLHPSYEGMTLWQYAHGEDARTTALLYTSGEHPHYSEIDAHTGEIVQSGDLDPFTKILRLPHPVKNASVDRHSFLLLHPTQDGDLVGRWLEQPKEDVNVDAIVWETQSEEGTVRGLAPKKTKDGYVFSEIWRIRVGGKIYCATERGGDDPVHSYTKVLGDRRLLFKYLNPNTAFIVAGEEGQEFDDAHLEAFVIDTVTGRILFRQFHEASKGPVHAVISQHWVAYHYWSISNQRFQLSTLEMYDASHHHLTASDLLFKNFQSAFLSSYLPVPLHVYNATFFVPTGVTHLSATKTAKGITTQLLLMATATDQIYAMNRRFLDPRRPLRSTPATQEERLIPYAEQLPIIATQYATYHRYVLGLKGMEASPAGLESGTHLFAYGIDIYYTRLQPERGFDTLDEDFNYGFLILTLLAMIVGSVVFRSLVRDAKLAKKWK